MSDIGLIMTVNNDNLINDFAREYKKYLSQEIVGLRVNFAKENENLIEVTKKLKEYTQKELILDIPYPYQKARVYSMDNERFEIHEGDILNIFFDKSKITNMKGLFLDCKINVNDLRIHETIHIGDGEGSFKVTDFSDDAIKVKALNTFTLISGKSLATAKLFSVDDYKKKIRLSNVISKINPETIALSFVQTDLEVLQFRKSFSFSGKVYAKIENIMGVKNVERIINVVDGIILARGDFSIYCPMSMILEQEYYISNLCKESGKEFIIATGILGSLKYRTIPSSPDIIDCLLIKEIGPNKIVINAGQDVARTINVLKQLNLNSN